VVILPFENIPEELVKFISLNFRLYCSAKGFITKVLLEEIFQEIIIKNINERRKLLN
jgi:hypothetical protein